MSSPPWRYPSLDGTLRNACRTARRAVPTTAVLLIFGFALMWAGVGMAAERQSIGGQMAANTNSPLRIRGHIPVAALKTPPLARLSGATNLDLVLALPLRNREQLTNLIQQIYDPKSTNYRRYLSSQEFAERFGPSEKDYARVLAFAKAQGFRVTGTHPNRTLVDVNGSASQIFEPPGVGCYKEGILKHTLLQMELE